MVSRQVRHFERCRCRTHLKSSLNFPIAFVILGFYYCHCINCRKDQGSCTWGCVALGLRRHWGPLDHDRVVPRGWY